MALSRSSCFGAAGSPLPGAGAFERVHEKRQPAVDVAGRDFFGRGREARRERGGRAGLRRGIERGVEFAAGLGQDQLAQQIGPPLRDAKRDMSAAGMPHQVDRPGIELLDEGDHVGDVLRDRIAVARGRPSVRERSAARTTAITRCFRVRGPSTGDQMRKSHSEPCTHTSGGPWPMSR